MITKFKTTYMIPEFAFRHRPKMMRQKGAAAGGGRGRAEGPTTARG